MTETAEQQDPKPEVPAAAAEETAPVMVETALEAEVAEQAAPTAADAAPAAEDTAPAVEDAVPAVEDAAPAADAPEEPGSENEPIESAADEQPAEPGGEAQETLESRFGIEDKPEAQETEDDRFRAVLEAVIYVTDEPLSAKQIAEALGRPVELVEKGLTGLAAEYAKSNRGLAIREVAGGFKMSTKPEFHEEIRTFVKKLKPPLKLSLAALETLAVIAYKQPITGPEIMEIRGVQGGGVLKTLLDRKLITTAGRKQVVGRPVLYRTTKDFLVQFGLKDLAELPTLKEFEEWSRLALGADEPEPAEPPPSQPAPAEPTPAAASEPAPAAPPEPETPVEAASATEPVPDAPPPDPQTQNEPEAAAPPQS